jgi:hypothetical protein
MGPHRRIGIYVGYQSPSIIKYLEPLIGDLFTARYVDCIFYEDHFSELGGETKYQNMCQEIDWNVQGIPASYPCSQETEFQVLKIINLQHIANNLPDIFTDYKYITKSLVPARNVPESVEIPQKTTQPPKQKKSGSSMSTVQEKASCNQLWK